MFASDFCRDVNTRYRLTDKLVVTGNFWFDLAAYRAVKRRAGEQIGVSDFFLCIVTDADHAANDPQRFDRRMQLRRCE